MKHFSYNSTLCYLVRLVKRVRKFFYTNEATMAGELKEKKAAEHNAGGELRKIEIKTFGGNVQKQMDLIGKAIKSLSS